jgi:hypothetical protein
MLVAGQAVAQQRILNDFDDFYVVGQLYHDGSIVRAYDNDYLLQSQQRLTGAQTFMPWAYFPQLTALVPLLPIVGMGWSYLIFTGGTLALYVLVLRRVNAAAMGAGLLAVYPALLLDARLGQNGFLTSSLIGLFVLSHLARRSAAGVPLGILVLKPHLAVGIGMVTLLDRRWMAALMAATIIVASSFAASIVLGWGVWLTFFRALGEASGFLKAGAYPLYRMASVYAAVRSFDVPATVALAVHAGGAIAAIGILVGGWLRGLAPARLAALSVITGLFVSPYLYDYDLACLAVALGLIASDLFRRMRLAQLVVFYGLAWLGSGWGLLQHFNAVVFSGTTSHPHGSALNWSLQALGTLSAGLYASYVLSRPDPDLRATDRLGAAAGPVESIQS